MRADRPELTRLLRDILREGDTLVARKLDRLARFLKHLIDTASEFREREIGLMSLTDAIDMGSPGGTLLFHMLGTIAEFKRALIRDRTTAGLAEARRKGRVGSRPKGMQAKDVKAACALLADGSFTSKEVAARFDVSNATLYKHLAATAVMHKS